MAKRVKRTSARKKAASRRTQARTRGTSARTAAKRATKTRANKGADRAAVMANTKKRRSKAHPVRATAKKAVPRSTEPFIKPAAPQDETVLVDIIEQPLPGVMVVTEFETVRTRVEAPGSHAEATEGFGVAEEEEDED